MTTTPPAPDGGPYYKRSSPQRASLLEPGIGGTRLVISGWVLSTTCRPVEQALLDFWQADDRGQYDNSGFRLRGTSLRTPAAPTAWRRSSPGCTPGARATHPPQGAGPQPPGPDHPAYFPGEGRATPATASTTPPPAGDAERPRAGRGPPGDLRLRPHPGVIRALRAAHPLRVRASRSVPPQPGAPARARRPSAWCSPDRRTRHPADHPAHRRGWSGWRCSPTPTRGSASPARPPAAPPAGTTTGTTAPTSTSRPAAPEFGPRGRDSCRATAGDLLHVPRGAVHREANDGTEESVLLIFRVARPLAGLQRRRPA